MRIIIRTFIPFFVCFVSSIFISAQTFELHTEADGIQWKTFEKYGYLGVEDAKGRVIIPAKFTYVNYENGTFTVKDNRNHIGKYSRDGKIIFPPLKYSNVFHIEGDDESPFIVIGEHWGVVDRKGKVLLDDIYSNIRPYGDPKRGYHYLLWRDGYMGVADEKGKFLIAPNKYFEIGENIGDDGKVRFMCAQYDGGSSVYDDKGELLIHTDYFLTVPKGKGKDAYYEISDGNSSGKMDLNGNIIEPISDKKSAMLKQVESDGKIYTIWRGQDNKCFVKDPDDNIIIGPNYDRIGFYNNHFVVGEGRYTGLINNKGKIIVPTDKEFVTATVLDKYAIATNLDDKQAIFGLDGKEIFPPMHKKASLNVKKIYEREDSIVSFRDAIGCWGVKDLTGNILVEPIYDDLNFIESDLGFYFLVFKNGKVGLQDFCGNMILEPEYIGIKLHPDKEFPFFYINTGYMGIADLDGNIIINPELFEEISFDSKKQQFTGIIGKRKCVFSNAGRLLSDNKKEAQAYEFTDLADIAFEKKNYKKAAELYSEAIAISPSALLYFNRGISYYNANKYYEAIDDFYETLNSNPSERLRDRSLDLIEKAEYYQEQKEYNKGQLVSAIFGLAMTGANYAIQPKSKGTNKRTNNSSLRSSSSSRYNNEDVRNSPTPKQKHKCGICGGKGSTVEYAPTYGIVEEKWCDDCAKKVVNGHFHKTCIYCHGTGER